MALDDLGVGVLVDAESLVAITVDEAPAYGNLWEIPQITDCYYGIVVNSSAEPVIRNAFIAFHHMYCVQIGPGAVPDLGRASSSEYGNNIIRSVVSSNGRLAGGKVRLPGVPDVRAEKNYWGSNPPDATKISTWVDYIPYLTQAPFTPAGADVPPVATLVAPLELLKPGYPLPFSSHLTLPVGVKEAGPATVEVYDISGRRVRMILSSELDQGEHLIRWDGQLDNGARAPSGIYFVRVKVGPEQATQKVVLTR
jgi:hypothetical protein